MRKTAILAGLLLFILVTGSVAAKPDLSSSSESIVFENSSGEVVNIIFSGEKVNISVTVSNTGNEPANFSVAFYDGNPSDGGKLIGTADSHVNGSDYSVVTITWQPDPQSRGYHAIWVLIDPDNTVDEIDESNNEYHRTIFIQIPSSIDFGLHVMAVGLTVVLSSLIILATVLQIFGKIVEGYEAKHAVASAPSASSAPAVMDEKEKAAVISAAIEAYEEDTGGK